MYANYNVNMWTDNGTEHTHFQICGPSDGTNFLYSDVIVRRFDLHASPLNTDPVNFWMVWQEYTANDWDNASSYSDGAYDIGLDFWKPNIINDGWFTPEPVTTGGSLCNYNLYPGERISVAYPGDEGILIQSLSWGNPVLGVMTWGPGIEDLVSCNFLLEF